MKRPGTLAALLLAAAMARAQDDPEGAALSLADRLAPAAQTAKVWQLALEAAPSTSSSRDGGPALHGQRLSCDMQLEQPFARDWRAFFSDQLDLRRQHGQSDTVNTLREAYLGWQPQPQQLFDLGRVNVRHGVASGYNPTDYFRRDATRSIVSIDPVSLKKNRLGSVMLRSQTLWNGGALTALYSPKLAEQPSDAPFSPDLGATNGQNRWLIALSQRWSQDIQPQWLLYGEQGRSPQLGLNLTYLLSDATVAHFEWSGGHGPSQLAQALQGAQDKDFRSRLATGLTHTTGNKISLTAEYAFNGAGLDRGQWDALGRREPAAYARYRQWLQSRQEMPTRHALFFYAAWQDALLNHLDLNAMMRMNADDRSRLSWLEARYHWDHADLALQWQHNGGKPGSEFGALPQRHVVQALIRYFF